MKSTKSSFKSFKNIVSKSYADKRLVPNQNFGEIVIPIGSDNLFVELPSLSETSTFNIVNAAEMTGDITLKTSGGASLKGLMLNTSNGSLSIDPIRTGTDELTLEGDVKDGCYIQTLSNGNQWFIWSVATGGTISVRTGGVIATYTPTPPVPVYANITNVVITSDVRFVGSGLEARHDLVLSGEGEPGAFLTISETTGNSDAALVFPVTIQIASDGTWELNKNTLATNLPNGSYTFDFTPTLGNGVQGKTFTENTGAINFTVPSTFTPDPAEVVDFASGASAVKPDSTQIAVVVDSSAWNSSLVHGDTFDIIYSITDPAVNGGVTVSQTVTGTIVDDTPPAAPVISAVSIANINELSANGTAEPNKTITLFQDSLPLSPTVTSDGAGFWSFGPVVLNFNSNFTLKAQASEDGVGNPNRSAFGEYSPTIQYNQPVTDTPTIGVDGEQTSVWTNTANSFTISGGTVVGATIEVLDGANPATLVSGPTVFTDPVTGEERWTATIDVANESVTSLSAKATLAGHHPSQPASFQLNVDRVPPTITLTGGAQTVGLPNVGSSLDLGFSVSDASSGVATETSDWDSVVSTTTEGTYTVTYNATDVAGNPAIAVTRDVTVTTEVIVPVITNITANVDGTFTVEGTVTGTFADNLTVQVTIGGSNSGTPVTVSGGSFIHTTSAQSPGTYGFQAKSINTASQESALSFPAETATISVPDTTAPVITITNDDTLANITDTLVTINENDTFTFTVTATDIVDGDISGNVIQSGNTLDTTTAGTYNLTFDVSDSANNSTQATLTVEVLAPAIAGTFIEELSSLTLSNATITSGVFSKVTTGGYGLLSSLDSEGIVAFNGDGTRTQADLTVSFWFRPDQAWSTGWRYVGGNAGSTPNEFRLAVSVNSGFLEFRTIFYNFVTTSGVSTATMTQGDWYHLAVTFGDNGDGTHDMKMFVNGQKVAERLNRTEDAMKLPTNRNFGIGAYAFAAGASGGSLLHSSDSWQISSGVLLSDSQVAAIYAQSDRQMSIATASTQP